MFRRSSIDKIVGKATKEEKLDILGGTDERFNDQAFEDLVGKEREKTPEELTFISLANEVTNAALRYYGLPEFEVPAQNVHVIPAEAYKEVSGQNIWEDGAYFNSLTQRVVITEQETGAQFLHTIIHEMFHFKSFHALQVAATEDESLTEYRSGLGATSRDDTKDYFRCMDEAMNEEMTRRAMIHVVEDPRFASEMARIQAIVDPDSEWDEDATMDFFWRFSNARPGKGGNIEVASYSYPREREALALLLEKLFAQNPGKFKDELELFDLFARTKLSGSLLPVGRLVDGTFGVGTFRKLGEAGEDEAFFDLVETL